MRTFGAKWFSGTTHRVSLIRQSTGDRPGAAPRIRKNLAHMEAIDFEKLAMSCRSCSSTVSLRCTPLQATLADSEPGTPGVAVGHTLQQAGVEGIQW